MTNAERIRKLVLCAADVEEARRKKRLASTATTEGRQAAADRITGQGLSPSDYGDAPSSGDEEIRLDK